MGKQTRPRKPGDPGMVKAKELELKALELRKAGATYEQIGRQCGCSIGGAHNATKRALARLNEEVHEVAEEVRTLEVQRLDALLLGLWDKARRGDTTAVATVLKIMERRARLMGLDAPPPVEIPVSAPAKPIDWKLATDEELLAVTSVEDRLRAIP